MWKKKAKCLIGQWAFFLSRSQPYIVCLEYIVQMERRMKYSITIMEKMQTALKEVYGDLAMKEINFEIESPW